MIELVFDNAGYPTLAKDLIRRSFENRVHLPRPLDPSDGPKRFASRRPQKTWRSAVLERAMDHDRIRQAQALRMKALKCRRWADTACDGETAARLTAMAGAYEEQAEAFEREGAAPVRTQQGR